MANRVKRSRPKKKFTRYTYGKAMPYLLKDFSGRCAYSLIHHKQSESFEVDHFNPRLKAKHSHSYTNLMPAYHACNRAKGKTWPSLADIQCGIRFLDPTKELDYGYQIFEDPNTHKLVGTTPAAIFHIRVLSLNSQYLIERRALRTQLRSYIQRPKDYRGPISQQDLTGIAKEMETLMEHADQMIPDIPPPPSTTSSSAILV